MSWPQISLVVLEIIAAIVIAASTVAAIAVLVQIVRQGGWRLAEPSIIKSRWRMVRPWLVVGAVIGLMYGIGHYVLVTMSERVPLSPPNDVTSQLPPVKSQPRPTESGRLTE